MNRTDASCDHASLSSDQGPLWLGIHFPALPLTATVESSPAQPCAVIDRQRLCCVNPAAAAAGLRSGMRLASAYALAPALKAWERQPAREAEALAQLACWAYGLVQEVSLADNNTLLLEVGSCTRLYRSLAALLARADRELAAREPSIEGALARTPRAAWLAAQARGQSRLTLLAPPPPPATQLADIPLSQLPLDTATLTRLGQLGLATLGELLALPGAALGKRFGHTLLRYLQQLTGALPDPQPSFAPPPQFQRSLPFLDGIHDHQILLFPMKRLLGEFADYLRARQLDCRQLLWRFHDARAPQAELSIALSQARRDPATFLELSRLRLEQLELPEPVFLLELCSDAFTATTATTLTLFEEADAEKTTGKAAAAAQAELLDKLVARLGPAALQRPLALEQHWPEAAMTEVTVGEHLPADPAPTPPTGTRPAWLLPAPQPLICRHGRPWLDGELQLIRGPERINALWWQHAGGSRDYYEARLKDGSRGWIFRCLETGNWFLHGRFA